MIKISNIMLLNKKSNLENQILVRRNLDARIYAISMDLRSFQQSEADDLVPCMKLSGNRLDDRQHAFQKKDLQLISVPNGSVQEVYRELFSFDISGHLLLDSAA